MVATCEQCNKEYERKPSKVGRFCGMDCYGASKKGTEPWNKGKKTGYAPWKGKKRSKETIAKIKSTKLKTNYSHPQEVRDRISAALKGVSKGGVTKLATLIRGTTTYKQWRTDVFERDEYTCQECGASNCILNADHIVPFSYLLKMANVSNIKEAQDEEMLWSIDNGRTLCLECHKQTPTFGNRGFNVDSITTCERVTLSLKVTRT